jgi:CspA family cold shock protein
MPAMDRTPGSDRTDGPDGEEAGGRHREPPHEFRERAAEYSAIASLPASEIVKLLDPVEASARLDELLLAIDEENLSELSSSVIRTKSSADNHVINEPIFELAGAIKWFDASRGYGFIVPDNGAPDVLLHVSCLRAAGYPTALEGARVVVTCVARPKGIQTLRMLSMDDSTAVHPSVLPLRSSGHVVPESEWETAMVKWFNRLRGFGFLTRGEGTQDIFIHMETLRRFGFAELRPGQFLETRWGYGPKGLTAAEIRPKPAHQGWPHAT